MQYLKNSKPYNLLILICVIYFLCIFFLGIDRHWSYKTSIKDLGIFDQAIWGCLNGKILLNTSNHLSIPINWLGIHFHPILFIFVPFYKISPNVEWLIFAQSLAISLTAFPIYRISLKLLNSGWQSLVWALSFLLNPFVLSAAIWDFHPVSLATPFIALSIYYLIINNFYKLLLCVFIILLCKEHFGLLVFFLGVSSWIMNKNTTRSGILIAIGLAHTILLFLYVFPYFSPTGSHIMLSDSTGSAPRFDWLGTSVSDIIYNLILNPLRAIKYILFELNGLNYILFILVPYGIILPFLAPEILLIGSADLAINLISQNPIQHSIEGYHTISLIPVIVISSMYGLSRIKQLSHKNKRLVRNINLLVAISFLTFLFMCIPHIFGTKSVWQLKLFPTIDNTLVEVKKQLPSNASISIQSNIGPHFSSRYEIYEFPNKISEVDFIVLRLDLPIDHVDPNDRLFLNRFIRHLHMDPEKYLATINCILDNKEHKVHYFDAPWVILSKNAQGNIDNLNKQLTKLQRELNINQDKYNHYLKTCNLFHES